MQFSLFFLYRGTSYCVPCFKKSFFLRKKNSPKKKKLCTEYNSTQSHILYKVAKFSNSNILLCPLGLNTLAACSSAPWYYVQIQTCSSSKCHIPSSQWETRCQQATAMLPNPQWRTQDVRGAGAKKIKRTPVCKKSCWGDTLSYLVHCKGCRDGTLSCFIFHRDIALWPPCAFFTSRPPQPPQFKYTAGWNSSHIS